MVFIWKSRLGRRTLLNPSNSTQDLSLGGNSTWWQYNLVAIQLGGNARGAPVWVGHSSGGALRGRGRPPHHHHGQLVHCSVRGRVLWEGSWCALTLLVTQGSTPQISILSEVTNSRGIWYWEVLLTWVKGKKSLIKNSLSFGHWPNCPPPLPKLILTPCFKVKKLPNLRALGWAPLPKSTLTLFKSDKVAQIACGGGGH